jgi:hypothetical protein
VVVGKQVAKRSGDEELRLPALLATQHLDLSSPQSTTSGRRRPRRSAFFNSPRVHFMRNALAHAGKSGRRVVAAFIATAFAQDHAGAAKAQWRQVADQVRPKLPKLAALLSTRPRRMSSPT